jgi:nicotinate-nucleotide adenylyltransferase
MIRALYGGSFDPIHAGHVALVTALLERGLADRVHVVPARQSPLKDQAPGATGAQRLGLVELAVGAIPGVVVEERELHRPGPSYTIDTLTALAADHAGDRWRLVLGADQVADFPCWRDPEGLLALAEPLVVARGPITLAPPLAGRAMTMDDFDHPAAATEIRRQLAAGILPGPDLLPPAVAAAITAAALYGWPEPPGAAPEGMP